MTEPTVAEISSCVSVPPVSIAELPAAGALRILVLPDLHIPLGQDQKRLLLANRLFLDTHDWVVLLGDMTACYGTPGEYRHVNCFVEALDRPYSVVNGNHEFSFVPVPDASAEYGKHWQPAPDEVQRQQIRRFERFYGIQSSCQAGRHRLAGLCLLSVDRIASDNSAGMFAAHEAWFQQTLESFQNVPLVVFAHFPLQDQRLDGTRYYEPGRRPYYLPSAATTLALRRRSQPTYWFSGHVHFAPSHPLAEPYLTQDGVWQVHCPDGWGYGRPDNEKWHPEHYSGLFVRSVLLEPARLTVITTDLHNGKELTRHSFDMSGERPGVLAER